MCLKPSTKSLVADTMNKEARCILLLVLYLLLRPGLAVAVKVELDAESSTSSASSLVTAYSIARHDLMDDVYFEDSDSWSDSGTQYEGLAQAYQSHYPSSVAASVSVSSGSSSVYPEPGEQSIDGKEIYDVRFYVDCIAFPFIPDPESGQYTILAGFDCELNAEGSIVWDLLRSTEDEEIGTPVCVLLAPSYSLGGLSGGTVYEFRIFDWSYGVIGRGMEGPYEMRNYADPPDYGSSPEPPWQHLDIPAFIGDKIKLSYKMAGYAYTQDPSMGSNLNPVGEYPTMGLSVRVFVSAELLPDLIGEFSRIGFRYPPDPGATLQAEVKLLVTNIGEAATQPGQVIDMAFFLRPIDALDDSEDILVSKLNNILIDQLAPGRSKRIDLSVPIYIPAFTYGTYRLGVYIDSSNDVPESNEGNNAITSDAIITIRGGIPVWMPDLTGKFSKTRFKGSPSPGAIVRAEIDVSNAGNKATEAKQVIDIAICLRSCDATDDTDDISLITLEDQSISKLVPKRSKTFRAKFNLPAVLDEGEYLLVAKVDSSEVVDELNEDNNEVLSECFIIE